MAFAGELESAVASGELDARLGELYPAGVRAARERAARAVREFRRLFGDAKDAALFSGPGRTELGGNHTDHQHGRVLCGSVDLDILACAAPNGTGRVRLVSEGYAPVEVSLDSLEARPQEANTSAALVRGVAAALASRGVELRGFDAFAVSDIPSGSGLSSSAAYEILLGCMFSRFGGAALTPVELAKAGKLAENEYFGKPCGLMDQMGSAVGGAIFIDFERPDAPRVEPVRCSFARSGHALCIIDTFSCHAELTEHYAAITREMGSVAAFFGRRFLREVDEGEFRAQLPALRRQCGDRAVLRAMHFFAEDARAESEARALKRGDFGEFLRLTNESGLSSELLLQNISPSGADREQAVAFALNYARALLGGSGAVRVHGGGFAGTVQAFVPTEALGAFKAEMDRVLGGDACRVVNIRRLGGCVAAE